MQGATLDALGATVTTGRAIANAGTVDGGRALEFTGAAVSGGGTFRGNAVTIRTFGNGNNPVNGAWYLAKGLQVFPSSGNDVALTLGGYAKSPQVFNVMVNGNATLAVPSAWPAGTPWPANNAVVLPGAVRAANASDPGCGGGSLIVQATGNLSLSGSGGSNLVFPGSVVLKSGGHPRRSRHRHRQRLDHQPQGIPGSAPRGAVDDEQRESHHALHQRSELGQLLGSAQHTGWSLPADAERRGGRDPDGR